MYDKCWVADNLEQLRNRIEYAFNKVTLERVQNLARSTFRLIDATRRGNGLVSKNITLISKKKIKKTSCPDI